MTMRTSALGKQGLITTRIGLGCMGMSEFYGVTDDTTSIKVIHRALDLGVRFFDTSDMYGPYTNEMLLGNALGEKRKHVTLATKFGIVRDPANPGVRAYNGKPAYVKSSCEGSLKRLRTDVIDLYYLHRVDQSTPIEETVGAMGELVKEGKVRAIGLSEASSATIRRAHATFPISALQTEYSLWSRDPEDDLLDTCRELGTRSWRTVHWAEVFSPAKSGSLKILNLVISGGIIRDSRERISSATLNWSGDWKHLLHKRVAHRLNWHWPGYSHKDTTSSQFPEPRN